VFDHFVFSSTILLVGLLSLFVQCPLQLAHHPPLHSRQSSRAMVSLSPFHLCGNVSAGNLKPEI